MIGMFGTWLGSGRRSCARVKHVSGAGVALDRRGTEPRTAEVPGIQWPSWDHSVAGQGNRASGPRLTPSAVVSWLLGARDRLFNLGYNVQLSSSDGPMEQIAKIKGENLRMLLDIACFESDRFRGAGLRAAMCEDCDHGASRASLCLAPHRCEQPQVGAATASPRLLARKGASGGRMCAMTSEKITMPVAARSLNETIPTRLTRQSLTCTS